MKINKIRTIDELEQALYEDLEVEISSIDELNTFEHYSLEGDHDPRMKYLKKVYKIKGFNHKGHPYIEFFFIVFSKRDNLVYSSRSMGFTTKRFDNIMRRVIWDEDFDS